MLALILGFLGPFIPDLINFGKAKMDQLHEFRMMELRIKGENQAAAWKMEETAVRSDAEAFVVAHKQHESYGVKLLDAGKDATGKLPWYLVPVAWLFTFVDFLNAAIRPGITLWFLGFYLASKGDPSDNTIWASALTAVWDETDREILMAIVGFWFGKIARSSTNYGKI
jgi:hypothetical protein